MQNNQKTFYITTTLPYVNAELHMGHALEFVRTDTIARYKKLMGFDVFFNTGTDEHGSKIYEKAGEQGMEPQSFVDQGFENFKKSIDIFGVSKDVHFIRTTDAHHIKSAQAFWNKVSENGFIYKKNYQAKYCVGCESEKTDSDLNDKGECPDHPGRPLQIIQEENYFFKYSEFGPKLLEFYAENPNFVVPEFRFNEVKAFIERGLQDFSISRLKTKMPWGIPVPGDDEHVMYVWFDALTNYINTLGWPEDTNGDFNKYWVNGNPTQYCGKDNTRFQSAMWQAMLMAAGVPNSHQIVVNGFVMGEGGVKMSKTLGNVVNPKEIVDEYGTDALRYFLLREISSFEDSPFSKDRFKEAYNANLANGIGNLVSRVMTMAVTNQVILTDYVRSNNTEMHNYLENFDIKRSFDSVFNLVNHINGFIQTEEPFKKIKVNPQEARQDIKNLLRWTLDLAYDLEPFMPETAQKIQELIKANKKPETPLFLRK